MAERRIANRQARWLWLESQGLASPPTGPLMIMSIISKLGFVQLDTIRNITRAHHHILWSRNQHYREHMLHDPLATDRQLFEHFTHDASLLPMEYYPMWQRQFRRLQQRTASWHDASPGEIAEIKARIAAEGPLSTHAFDTKITGKKEMWARPPHKKLLDQLWYAGELATAFRQNFVKYYDLRERVIPAQHRDVGHDDAVQQDWLCRTALDRLAIASRGEIQRFWAAMDAAEVQQWLDRHGKSFEVVQVEDYQGSFQRQWAHPDIAERLAELGPPTSRLRILNPFDPAVRDRQRLERLFGFEYRNEMFVPPDKRRWGYYVYPLLEGDRFVGRMEAQADRAESRLEVRRLWPEPGVRWTARRDEKLAAELSRLARMIGVEKIVWSGEARQLD